MNSAFRVRRTAPFMAIAMISFTLVGGVSAQSGPAPTSRAAAPEDVTGYWVSLVTEDWRYRMVTPARGDYDGIPVNPEGKRLADAWDPAKDEASGNQCKAFGAAAITRVPGRLHITWLDDKTLKVEADAGTQTRLFHFDAKAPATIKGQLPWQGFSVASWDHQAGGGFGPPGPGGSLKIVTTKARPGYLRKNGVPYSANAVVTEYFDALKEPDGEQYLIVKTLVDDPLYLAQQFITSTHFKKEPDGSKWHPTPCAAR
jgi:hypothetical protein